MGDTGREARQQTLAELKEKSDLFFKEKQRVRAELDVLKKEQEKATEGREGFQQQRDALNEQIQAKIKERNTIRQERKDAETAYKAYLAQIRDLRQKRIQKEREERQKEYELRQVERKAEKLDEQ